MAAAKKVRRGFAAMDPAKQRQYARLGGQRSSGNFKFDPERAKAAGRRGGLNSRRHV